MSHELLIKGTLNNVFRKSKKIIEDLGLLDLIVDERGKIIYARSKNTWLHYGESYFFTFDIMFGYTRVTIFSSPEQFLDLGFERRFEKIIDAYDKAINKKTVKVIYNGGARYKEMKDYE